MAAQETLAHSDVAPCRKALFPSKSLTVETNCSGSSGFRRKASAPRCERLVARVERGDHQARRHSGFLQTLAQVGARTAGDEQLDHRELGAAARA